jgi:hypothetical protein
MPHGNNRAFNEILSGTLSLSTDVIKVGLATSTWVPNQDDDFLDLSTASDFQSGEISVTGYVGGFGGAGRRTLTSKTFTEDDANNRARFSSASITYTGLATGATIAAACLMREITSDALSRPITYNDLAAAVPTNGSDFTLNPPALGWFYLQT